MPILPDILLLRTCLTRPPKTVADTWDGPELLQPNLSKLLVLCTSGMALNYSSLACGPELLKANPSKLLMLCTCLARIAKTVVDM